MKKTYISPEALTVVLGTCNMMAESIEIKLGGTGSVEDTITGEEQILTKGHNSIWDEEW